MRFYVGVGWEQKIRKNIEYPYVFISVGCNYSYNCYKKLSLWKLNSPVQDIMLDSGGFSLLNRFGDYPFSIEDFVDWVYMMNKGNKNKVSYVATPDYPCEEEINRKCKYKTNFSRIEKTVENAIYCIDTFKDIDWMPVIQGYDTPEYELCLRMYQSRGVNPKKFAIGSMCRRSNIKTIEYHIQNLKELGLKQKIHLFGLCMNGLKSKYLSDNVDSCDSIAYTYAVKTQDEKLKKFDEMMGRVGNYLIKNKEQITLWDLYDLGENPANR